MRKILLLLAALGAPTFGPATAGEAPDLNAFKAESRAKVKAFAGSLKGALQAAIKEDGPGHAISVCNAQAPEIAASLSGLGGWSVGRTSHKLRNPNNAPDAWEAKVLAEFIARANAGEDFKTIEKAAVIEAGGTKTYRYMKAIPVGQICLTCHGTRAGPGAGSQDPGFLSG